MNVFLRYGSFCACLVFLSSLSTPHLFGQGQKQKQFSKPILMFDNASMKIARPTAKTSSLVEKLHRERALNEAVSAITDKNGMLRMAFLPIDGQQSNCTQYADMYFDKKERWISTEEFFVVEPDSLRGLGNILLKIQAALAAKKFTVGICEEGGKHALWRISTPANIWYECEIFKADVSNTALAIKTNKAPFQAPNLHIYGTAYFDANGNFVKIQAKSKVKELNPDLMQTASKQK